MQELLRALRQSMPAGTWSRGVQIHRERRVLLPPQPGADEVEVQILPAQSGATVVVVLYPQDAEWDCDCQADACEHAAAAAIALNHPASNAPAADPAAHHASAPPPPRPPSPPVAEVAYALRRTPQGLSLMRLAVSAGSQEPLGIALKVRQQQAHGPKLVVRASDMAVDAVLAGRRLPEVLAPPVLARVLRTLVDAPNVTLDNAPVTIGDSRPDQVARISRRAGGEVVVRLEKAAALDEVFANGAGRANNQIMPLTALYLSTRERAQLGAGLTCAPSELPDLLDDVLPRLERQIPLEWHHMVRPARPDVPVTVSFALQVQYDDAAPHEAPMPRLRVIPQVVYGPPIVARVQGASMRLCGDIVPRRQRDEEARWQALLGSELDMAPQRAHIARGDAGALLLVRVRGWALRHGALIDDQGGSQTAFRSRRALQARLEEQAGVYDVVFECAGEQPGAPPTRVPAGALLQAFARGESSLALVDGGFAPLPSRFLQIHHEALESFLAARDALRDPRQGGAGRLPGWAMAQLGRLCEALAVPPPPAAQQAFEALASVDPGDAVDGESNVGAEIDPWLHGGAAIGPAKVWPVPAGITLRPYQARGVAWLSRRLHAGVGALLADDMGLGKTLQALLSCATRTLIVVPTSLLGNWAAEAARFCPGRAVHVYHGARRTMPNLGASDLLLTTYGVLRADAAALCAQHFDVMLLDEAQAIKTPTSQAAMAAFTVGQSVRARLALSGTPLENRLDELWSLLHFCNPGLFGPRDAFVKRYEHASGINGPRLSDAIAPLMLRRKKSSVEASLPAKHEVTLRCTLSDEEQTLYDALALSSRNDVARKLEAGGSVIEALETLLRLRQAACHPGLLPGHAQVTNSAKVSALLDTLAPAVADGHRALVFSQWTKLLDLVEPHLRAAHIPFVRLDGSTKDRAAVVRTFTDESGPPVMLISLKAGGVGLNLTAADHVFLLDPWWNPAAEDQAADRAHRIGQVRKVLVHKLVATGTVDEQLIALQAHKRQLAAHSLGDSEPHRAGGENEEGSLGRAELLSLLRGAA